MFSATLYHFCRFSLHRLQFVSLFRYGQTEDGAQETEKLKGLRLELQLFCPSLFEEINKNSSAHAGGEMCAM